MADFFFNGWGILLIVVLIAPPILALRIKYFAKFGRWFWRMWKNTR